MGEVISGIISVFPAIISSTMFISYYEHGPDFSKGFAKSMIIGSLSVMSYAASIHFTYPIYGIILGSIIALCISIVVSLVIFKIKNKIS
jgi:hypothetical protein